MVVTIQLSDTYICEFKDNATLCSIMQPHYVECDAGDILIVEHKGAEVFRGEITSWEMGSDMMIEAEADEESEEA